MKNGERKMEKNEFTYPSADNKTTIFATEWVPDGEVRAVLQIAHGMVEYIDRYDAFAYFLAEHGIYVTGNDHLGHGRSVTSDDEHGFFAHPNGNECVIKDMDRLRLMTAEKYPGVPYFFLGHSMGSFLLRQYLTRYGKGLAGAIIMGTGQQPAPVLNAGKMLCSLIAMVKGWHHRSSLINNMAFGSYNKPFEPARTPCDWLSREESNVNKYMADPWCTYMFTVNGYHEMFTGIQQAQDPKNIDRIPKDLPVFFVAGAEDPVGEAGKGVKACYDSYVNAGILDISIKLYENDRHEILNEVDKDVVFSDLLEWMEKYI